MKKTHILILASSVLLSSHVNGTEANLCASDETEIAACQLSEPKKRLFSFCTKRNSDVVSYRFGTARNIELEIDFNKENRVQRWTDLATYTVYLGFKRGDYAYSFGIPQETLNAKAFLIVKKGNEQIGHDKTCTSNSFGEKNIPSNAILDVNDEAIRNNRFNFPY